METAMKKRAKFGDRLAHVMTQKEIKPKQLAGLMQINHPSIYQWLANRSKPNGLNLLKLADCLGVSVSYLANGTEENKEMKDAYNQPVVTLPLMPDNVKINRPISESRVVPLDWMPAPRKDGVNRFFLQMKDSSMTSQQTGAISVPKDAYVIVVQDKKERSGNYVACKIGASTRTLIRRYLVHGKDKWLEAHDPSIPRIKINDSTVIVGVVTDIQIPLK